MKGILGVLNPPASRLHSSPKNVTKLYKNRPTKSLSQQGVFVYQYRRSEHRAGVLYVNCALYQR